jgi:ribonuclease HI
MIIYTDGSAHPNPGPGGFAVIVLDDNEKIINTYTRQFSDEEVTNNEMEMKAILYAFFKYGTKDKKTAPIVYSDSNYCIQTFNNWMFNWQKKNWIKADKKRPENLELVKAYYNWYKYGYRIDLRYIKGHEGHQWNELADALATGRESPESIGNSYGKL